ncbi:MAG: dephospho-CoA kinase [Acidobacteria bacterium]|nr:MAG: dephospho-CoA kinase [Acidobacteriota bacterium]
MLKVGLTGGIASGKSVVGEMFTGLGAQVVQADLIAHLLMQPGEAVYQQVVQHFGSDILRPDGTVDRRKLAEAAFGSPEQGIPSRIEELNRIVHPAVIQRQEEWMEDVMAALILEAGAGKGFDRLVVVTCRPEQRIERWARRLQVDHETARREVVRRMASQLPDEEKIKAADYVIDNSGWLDETQRQVKEIHGKLKAESGGGS